MATQQTSVPIGTTLILALSATSAQSAAIGGAGSPSTLETVRLCSTVDCWLTVGSNPTAMVGTAASFLLPAGLVEYIDVTGGDKIAGIAGGAGTLSIALARQE
jgi:hypothetical protein